MLFDHSTSALARLYHISKFNISFKLKVSTYDRNTDLHKIGELEPYDGSLLGKSPTRSHKSWHGVNFSTSIFPLQKAIHILDTQILTDSKDYERK